MKVNLPEQFCEEMRHLLGEEYQAYVDSFETVRSYGLRVNNGKCSPDEIRSLLGKDLRSIPWIPNGLFYEEDIPVSKHPCYYAGLYYLQEPSAMTPASILPVKPGDRVLDLCAAPGGKSTELGAKLKGEGVLVANDISHSRALALLRNLERFGIPNLFVTSEPSEKLADAFQEWFNAILVDAPCSGEGMFRKNPEMVADWMEKGPDFYAPIQRQILKDAVSMLARDGHLLYSTCTFSPKEDEENILWLLSEYPEMELVEVPLFEGARTPEKLPGTIRLFPFCIEGEGHFLALLHKKADDFSREEDFDRDRKNAGFTDLCARNVTISGKDKGKETGTNPFSSKKGKGKFERNKPEKNVNKTDLSEADLIELVSSFFNQMGRKVESERIFILQDEVYELPKGCRYMPKLRYLRTGLHLGTIKNQKFEPSQALAMTLDPSIWNSTIKLSLEDDRVIRYLKGESLSLSEEEAALSGEWCLVCLQEYPLGFAKKNGSNLKNKYHSGWRWM